MTYQDFKKQIDANGKYSDEYLDIIKSKSLLGVEYKVIFKYNNEKHTLNINEDVSFAELMILTSNFIDDTFFRLKSKVLIKELKGAFEK